MKARDIMTANVVTVTPETAVSEVARLMIDNRISGVPVIDNQGLLKGIVTEGDMLRRAELSGGRPSAAVISPETRAAAYVKAHGAKAGDMMTTTVITVGEDETADHIAMLLEARGIKRVPVVKDGRVIGIVSRANLLRSLAAGGLSKAKPDDGVIRSRVMADIRGEAGARAGLVDVTLTDGVAYLWGMVASEDERQAIRVVAENTPGVNAVHNHLRVMPEGLVEYQPE